MTGPLTRAEAGRALATLALALAYGTDRVLTDDEADTVVARLHARAPDVDRLVVERLVGRAARTFGHDAAAARAADALRTLPACLRREALGDLRAVAAADGYVQGAEAAFLDRLARRWALPPPGVEVPAPAAPVLADLAALAVALGIGADGDLASAEAAALRQALHDWQKALGGGDADAALGLALRRGGTGRDRRLFDEAAEHAAAVLDPPLRARVLADLTALARADGRLLAREADLLDALADAWADG